MRISLRPRAQVSTQLFYTVKTISCYSAKLPCWIGLLERAGETTRMDAGGKAPTVGASGDAGAIAEENKIYG